MFLFAMALGTKILLLLLQTSIFLRLQSIIAFVQNDWHMIHERAVLHYYNSKLSSNVKLEMRFFNRTTKAYYWQFELIEDLDADFKVHYNAYKLYSNEYRGFPITVKFNLCEELEKTLFGFSDMKIYSNITNCPWKKGLYVLKDFVPDERKLPPYVPHGRYKAVIQLLYHSELAYESHIFTEVKGIKRFGNTTVYV